MKKTIITIIITMILTSIATIAICFYNTKVVDVENGNIKIDMLGLEFVYYFEQ